ncbi:MAG: CHAD domain-containing protein [Methylococcaceae bacterium]|nr:CHAD domain-containing protein [Methylococcaceae bacterium]
MKVSNLELPPNLKAEGVIEQLGEKVALQLFSKQYLLKTFYDSFDWRLYRNNLICEFNRSRQTSIFTLTEKKSGEIAASSILFDVPSFSKQFNPGKVRQILEPLLEMRALLTVSTLECEAYQIFVHNEDDKIVLRLLIEEFQLLNSRVTIYPVKGYDKIAAQVNELLIKKMDAKLSEKPVMLEALRLQGRRPKDYSSKLEILLTPEMQADAACKLIFSNLLRTIKVNEQGAIGDIDSEFLHDFRVAVRRTRTALGQVKTLLPEDLVSRYKVFFSWLGKITCESRDLDVYLLNFDKYKKKLPPDIRQSLNPLNNFLLQKKQKSHKELAKKLRSSKYLTMLTEWEQYLSSNSPIVSAETIMPLSVKQFADNRIWKAYKQVIKQGEVIDKDSRPEALHQLRKTCKKLRYLIEFFKPLYAEKPLEQLIKSLKRLQDVLGEYQDLAVQQAQLKQFSEEMQTVNIPSKTFMAMGVLIQALENRKIVVREHFDDQFHVFRKRDNHELFHDLFATRKT